MAAAPLPNCTALLNPSTYGYAAQDGTTMFASDFSLESTYLLGKLTCLRSGYFWHVTFCYCVFITGIGAMLSRVWEPIKWTHVWWGRLYIMFMLQTTATSMIIHNSGLPLFTLKLFLVVMVSIPIGWFVINFYQKEMETKALKIVQAKIADGIILQDLGEMVSKEKGHLAQSKTFSQRFFSKKSFHGIMMVLSWACVGGRIPFSDQSGQFTCHTYSVYKPLQANRYKTEGMDLAGRPLQLVPLKDPNFAGKPWDPSGPFGGDTAFTMVYIVMVLVVMIAVGVAFSWRGARGQLGKLEHGVLLNSTNSDQRSDMEITRAHTSAN